MSYIALDVAMPRDALTAFYLVKYLERMGVNWKIFARDMTQTIPLLDILGLPYQITGRYGYTIEEKALYTLEQEKRLLDIFISDRPSLLWSDGNVAGIRAAFHLGIPIVYSNDTPHNIPVLRLTVALARKLITPVAVPKCKWVRYGISPEDVIEFYGTQEVTWVKDYLDVDRRRVHEKYLGFEADRLIVVRNIEYYAMYSYGVKYEVNKILEKLTRYGTVAFLPRYKEDLDKIGKIKNLHVIDKPVLAVELISSADMLVSSGGTMAREAALLGIPTISFHFRDDVLRFIMGEGFPVRYIPDFERIIREVELIMRDPDKYRMDTKKQLNSY